MKGPLGCLPQVSLLVLAINSASLNALSVDIDLFRILPATHRDILTPEGRGVEVSWKGCPKGESASACRVNRDPTGGIQSGRLVKWIAPFTHSLLVNLPGKTQ